MSDQSKLGLGQIITTEQSRDAVHVAVAPVVAAHDMVPGAHVGLDASGKATMHAEKGIGIADPFLKKRVRAGQRFWLYLYPGSITSLRHEWTHPAFEVTPIKSPMDASVEWLKDMAHKCGVSYDRMISAVEEDDYINMGENEEYKGHLDGHMDEFQRHCEVVTGKTFKHPPYPFSCSC